jgi:Copper type II ascorbate-dependent monooxygenase, C-terminal domain
LLFPLGTGEGPTAMPQNIGIPMFDPNGNFRSIALEIHYNNPETLEGLVDTSGFRIYYSTQPREIEAAWLMVGDPDTLLDGQPIEDGLTNFTFSCASDCTENILGSDSVTVMIEYLHMHKSGIRMTNELIRNGEVANLAVVEVFEFHQQGSFQVQQGQYKILPGDSFRTSCYYRDGTKFGFSSQEEMCVALLLYYPAKRINLGSFGSLPWSCMYGIDFYPTCKEELEFQTIESVESLGRRFGNPSQCMTGSHEAGNGTISAGSQDQTDSGTISAGSQDQTDSGTTSAGSEDQTDSAHEKNFLVILNVLMVVCTFLSM